MKIEVNKIICGDCLVELKTLPENSVDSIVTDPPYHLVSIVKRFGKENSAPAKFGTDGAFSRASKGFMGKDWDGVNEDGIGIAQKVELWKECLRVLKPGGHLLAFSGTRTYHRMASAIEDAGFDIRDQIAWCYGQGFPKSLNISLQIKKKYNIDLCTCNVFEPMIQLGYENSNNKRNNISNGDNDGLGSGEQIQDKGANNNEVEEQVKDTHLSPDDAFGEESGVCELSEKDSKKKQGLKKVSKSVLRSGVCKSISENEGLGNTTLRSGVEKAKATSEGKGQGVSDMQNQTTDGITGSSLNTIQNGRQELNGELSGSLSQLPQQDRENNRKRVEQIKNDCNAEEWNNLSRFICSKCYCLKKDIGGTALKPSIEPICMARKPLAEKTVAENCLKWGTGGINIDESRVNYTSEKDKEGAKWGNQTGNINDFGKGVGDMGGKDVLASNLGRFPANLIHDNSEEVRECFPETKGWSGQNHNNFNPYGGNALNKSETTREGYHEGFNDSGNASRFFKSIIYQAKASKSERNRGCEGLEAKPSQLNSGGIGRECSVEKRLEENGENAPTMKNNHPTVKPIALMEYLIKMVTPKGGIVLDPFAGSGSTLVAAKQNGFQYIGIELTPEYIPIIEARLKSKSQSVLNF